ncbi:MAG TPA: Mur ligase family protein [Clostridia bacterium]|nr:Mur ligase family protein [Clostridia bacterium]
MILRELLASTPVFEVIGRRRIDVKGIALHPGDVKKGYLYIFRPEESTVSYEEAIDQAIQNGAIAIVVGADNKIPKNTITFIRTYHQKRFLSAISRNFYNNPSQNMSLVGITGSHGKTTVGWMIKSILNVAGIPGVMLGIDYCQVGDHSLDSYPGGMNPLNMNEFLYKAVKEQVRWGIIECTYTGIVEDRFSHIWFDGIIYTDLYTYFQNRKADYHYFEMRKTLIDHLKTTQSPVIVNVDDFYAFHLQRDSSVGYGLFNEADITARELVLFPDSSDFVLLTPGGHRRLKLNIPGIHNVYNALAAASWGLAEGLDLDDVVRGIEAFKDMPGLVDRMEFSNSILIKDILDSDLGEIEKAFKNLWEDKKGGIVTVLCMDDSQDVAKYKRLGNIIGRHGGHCIMIHDYFSNSDMAEMESVVEKKMDNIRVHHQTDYYKAIQKAATFLPMGGHILLVRG